MAYERSFTWSSVHERQRPSFETFRGPPTPPPLPPQNGKLNTIVSLTPTNQNNHSCKSFGGCSSGGSFSSGTSSEGSDKRSTDDGALYVPMYRRNALRKGMSTNTIRRNETYTVGKSSSFGSGPIIGQSPDKRLSQNSDIYESMGEQHEFFNRLERHVKRMQEMTMDKDVNIVDGSTDRRVSVSKKPPPHRDNTEGRGDYDYPPQPVPIAPTDESAVGSSEGVWRQDAKGLTCGTNDRKSSDEYRPVKKLEQNEATKSNEVASGNEHQDRQGDMTIRCSSPPQEDKTFTVAKKTSNDAAISTGTVANRVMLFTAHSGDEPSALTCPRRLPHFNTFNGFSSNTHARNINRFDRTPTPVSAVLTNQRNINNTMKRDANLEDDKQRSSILIESRLGENTPSEPSSFGTCPNDVEVGTARIQYAPKPLHVSAVGALNARIREQLSYRQQRLERRNSVDVKANESLSKGIRPAAATAGGNDRTAFGGTVVTIGKHDMKDSVQQRYDQDYHNLLPNEPLETSSQITQDIIHNDNINNKTSVINGATVFGVKNDTSPSARIGNADLAIEDVMLLDLRHKIERLVDSIDQQNRRMDSIQRSFQRRQDDSRMSQDSVYRSYEVVDDEVYCKRDIGVGTNPRTTDNRYSTATTLIGGKKSKRKLFCIN